MAGVASRFKLDRYRAQYTVIRERKRIHIPWLKFQCFWISWLFRLREWTNALAVGSTVKNNPDIQCQPYINSTSSLMEYLDGGNTKWRNKMKNKIILILLLLLLLVIRHELGFDRPVSGSSNSLFQSLPSRLRTFGLHFSIIFWHPVAVHSCYMS